MQETLREVGLIPGLGRSPGGGHSNPVQYSCLENPHGQKNLVGYSLWDTKESDTTEATQHTYTTIYLLTTQSISQCSKLVMDTGTIMMQIKNLGFHRRKICIESSPPSSPGSYSTISHASLNFRKPVLRQHGWTRLSSCSLLCSVSWMLCKIWTGAKRVQCIFYHSSLCGKLPAMRQPSCSSPKTTCHPLTQSVGPFTSGQ